VSSHAQNAKSLKPRRGGSARCSSGVECWDPNWAVCWTGWGKAWSLTGFNGMRNAGRCSGIPGQRQPWEGARTEAGIPQTGSSRPGAAAEITAWKNTPNSGNDGGGSRRLGGGSISPAARAGQGRGEPPPEVNLTLSWWNTAVIRLPVTVPRLCQAALTMAVN